MELVGYFRGEGASRRLYKDDNGYFYITEKGDDEGIVSDYGDLPPFREYRSDYADSPEELLLRCTPGFYWFQMDGSIVDFERWYAIHLERLRTREGAEHWE